MNQYRILRNVRGYWLACGWYTANSEQEAIAMARKEFPNQMEFIIEQTRTA